jgi:hypothetical protein
VTPPVVCRDFCGQSATLDRAPVSHDFGERNVIRSHLGSLVDQTTKLGVRFRVGPNQIFRDRGQIAPAEGDDGTAVDAQLVGGQARQVIDGGVRIEQCALKAGQIGWLEGTADDLGHAGLRRMPGGS